MHLRAARIIHRLEWDLPRHEFLTKPGWTPILLSLRAIRARSFRKWCPKAGIQNNINFLIAGPLPGDWGVKGSCGGRGP